MTDKKETFLLLDGNALLHRAWHALPPLTTKDGTIVNAAYGFAMVLEKMLENYKPTYMAVAWDRKEKTFRHEEFEDYKAHRETKEQELYDQIPLIQEILDAFGIPSLDKVGFEADDIIGTLAKKSAKKGVKTYIVTGDLDALQLVDEWVRVVFFQKGISKTKEYDIEAVKERYGLVPEELIDYKALRGDPSDNIPGVAGIGEKSATELIQTFGSVEGVFKALGGGEVPSKFAKKLEGNEKAAKDSLRLVEIVTDVPLTFRFASAKMEEPNRVELMRIYRDLEFGTLIRKYTKAPPLEVPKGKEKKVEKEAVVKKGSVELVSQAQFPEAIKALSHEMVGFHLIEQQADLFGSTMAALALSDGKHTVVLSNPQAEVLEEVQKVLKKAMLLVVHDLKALLHATDWEFEGKVFDLKIGSYLLHSGSRAHDINAVLHKELDARIPDVPAGFVTEKDFVTLGKIIEVFPKAAKTILSKLEDDGMEKVVWNIEMPLVRILSEMEKTGVLVDVEALEKFSKSLKRKLEGLTKKILGFAGVEFNINSPSQLADVLFEKLDLPTKGIKKTKTGFSTAASELEKLWDEHEIIPLISEYRELAKLKSTYADALPMLVKQDGRIHSSFNQVVTATGRLSSSEPNLQNIPIRTELGNEIRKAFVAPRGKRLLCADYSQIELRLAAIITKDKPFINAFLEGADIHTRTASEVWEVKEEDVTKEQRRSAKAINFGILYGMGATSLARSTNMTRKEAKEFIDRYFWIHHALKDYLEKTKEKAHEDGYVDSLFGRRRYLPEIHSGVHPLVAAAERMAINMPIQGTASDIMKKAMIAVDGWLKQSGWPAQVLMQVHDELVIEVASEAVDQVAKGVKEMMEGVAEFEVPLVVDVEVGKNWGEKKKWEG